jgi:hypothetical protein
MNGIRGVDQGVWSDGVPLPASEEVVDAVSDGTGEEGGWSAVDDDRIDSLVPYFEQEEGLDAEGVYGVWVYDGRDNSYIGRVASVEKVRGLIMEYVMKTGEV